MFIAWLACPRQEWREMGVKNLMFRQAQQPPLTPLQMEPHRGASRRGAAPLPVISSAWMWVTIGQSLAETHFDTALPVSASPAAGF